MRVQKILITYGQPASRPLSAFQAFLPQGRFSFVSGGICNYTIPTVSYGDYQYRPRKHALCTYTHRHTPPTFVSVRPSQEMYVL